MAIRGPGGPRPEPRVETREQPQSPTQRLVDFGSAKTPQEAVKLLKEILTLLAAAGFPVAKTGSPDQQLSSTLKELQKREGLPQTGQLDQKTFDALDRLGLLPKKEAAPESIDQKSSQSATSELRFDLGAKLLGADRGLPRGGGEVPAGSQKTRSVETDQAKARADTNKPTVEVDLKSMLNSLRSAGFAGTGKGKEQLQDAVKKLQRVDGLPITGNLDAKTAAALEKRGVIDAATAQALKEQDPTYTPPQPPSSSESASPSSSSTTNSPSNDEGVGRGDDTRGQGGAVGDSKGQGKAGGEGSGAVEGAAGTTDHGDVDADDEGSDDVGNNYAGDEDDDEERGLMNVDADADDGAAHWEVKKLAQQVDEAFERIVRDDDGKGAATYGWEVRLHRPGIYSARQPAEELLHVVVKNAGPFDGVWATALDALNLRLRRYEPEAAVVDVGRLRLALQRARYRD